MIDVNSETWREIDGIRKGMIRELDIQNRNQALGPIETSAIRAKIALLESMSEWPTRSIPKEPGQAPIYAVNDERNYHA